MMRRRYISFISCVLLIAFCISMVSGCDSKKNASRSKSGDSEETSTSYSVPAKTLKPQYTEDEILNMSDEDLIAFGMILIEHGVEDVRRPNTKRADLNLGNEYVQLWRHASRSASSYDEAFEVIKEEWENSSGNDHKNIRLVTENDEFWLFACDFYYDDEFYFVFTTSVYKKSYYDEENSIAYFDLNEESIRHFFAYETYEADEPSSDTVIGEYVIKTEYGYIFRRYIAHICYGDWGLKDQVILNRMEWKIYSNGKFEYVGSDEFERQLDLPSQKLTDENPGFGA